MIVSRVHPKRGVQYVRRIVFRSRYQNYFPLVLWHADRALALDMPDAEAAELVAWLKRSSQYLFEVTT
jgi:hypothetical protein